MTEVFEVYYQEPEEKVTNWRHEVEVYGGYRYSKGVFTSREFAEKVARYYSGLEKKDYTVKPLSLYTPEEFEKYIVEKNAKEFERTWHKT